MVTETDPVSSGHQYGGRYQIKRSIASGGMAEVFMARDGLLNRPVALKLMHPQFARNKSFVERFRREAQAAASLNDPRVVSIYDWGSDDGIYYIVMEYVEGSTLSEIIQRSGPLEISAAVRIAADVCGGLHLAHSKGIVHRDIKPANIALTAAGQTKVMDFGIARAASDDAEVTQTGMVIGTAGYFSPEQAQGRPVDARSDVYSVGVVLYEMLTGTVPFKGESPVAVAYKHVTEDPAPVRELAGDVSPGLEAVVMKAMSKNADNRYQTADEMRLDLERILRGEQVDATPVLSVQERTALIDAPYRTRGAGVDRTSVMVAGDGRRGGGLGWILVLIVLIGLGAAGYYAFKALAPSNAPALEVPRVVGLAVEQAQRLIGEAGLGSVVLRQEFSSSLPVGAVISQDPEDGLKVGRGVKVQLVVSRGAEQVEVPDLTGLTQQQAEQSLIDRGLARGDVSTRPDDVVAQGKVVGQNPPPASRAEKGRQVALVVSSGKEQVAVPSLVGSDRQTAESQIAEAGLEPSVEVGCEPSLQDGLVVRQQPAPGARVDGGTAVKIAVNQTLTVPDVRGQSEAQARITLGRAGFQDVQTRPGSLLGLSDQVIAQNPAGSQRACPESTITIATG